DGNTAGTKLFRHIAREDLDGALHGSVCRVTRLGHARKATRDVDDPPAVCDEREDLLREEERRLEVNGDDLLELFLRRFHEAREEHCAGVVDEVIETLSTPPTSELGLQRLDVRSKAPRIGNVELHRRGPAPFCSDLCNDIACLLLPRSIGNNHIDTA